MCVGGAGVFTLRKAARVGYSTCLMAAIAYKLVRQRRNVAIYLPTDESAALFNDRNVEGALSVSPTFREGLAGSTTHKGNRKGYKKFAGGNQLYVRGGKARGNYAEITVNDVIYDEVDLFDRNIQGSGSPLTLGDGRTGVSFRAKSIRGSTPHPKAGRSRRFSAAARACTRWQP